MTSFTADNILCDQISLNNKNSNKNTENIDFETILIKQIEKKLTENIIVVNKHFSISGNPIPQVREN